MTTRTRWTPEELELGRTTYAQGGLPALRAVFTWRTDTALKNQARINGWKTRPRGWYADQIVDKIGHGVWSVAELAAHFDTPVHNMSVMLRDIWLKGRLSRTVVDEGYHTKAYYSCPGTLDDEEHRPLKPGGTISKALGEHIDVRIRNVLLDGPATPDEVAVELGLDVGLIARSLRRMLGKNGVARVPVYMQNRHTYLYNLYG